MVEKQKKFASLAFRKHYDTLQTAISTPDLVNSLASKLYKRLLITKETRDAVQFTTGISPMDKAAMLLQAVESTIQIDKHCLFRFVRLLKKQPILKPFAEKLRKEYRFLVEAGSAESSSSTSESEIESTDQSKEPTILDDLTEKNFAEINGKFGSLLLNVRTQLEKLQNINIKDDLCLFLLSLLPGDASDCISNCSDLSEMFKEMTRNRLWDYWHYFLLEQVIKRFVPQLTDEMEQYKRDRTGFQLVTKIKDFIPMAKFSDPESVQGLETKRTTRNLKRLSVVLDQCVSDNTLQYVEELWESLASILRLPPLTAVLDVILEESVRIVWLIPSDLVPQAIEMAHENANCFREHPILNVVIGNECVFKVERTKDAESLKIKEAALLKACAEGRLEDVTTLLSQGIDVNTRDPKDSDTSLNKASLNGHTAIVKELLAVGAKVNIQDNDGNTALIKASSKGHTAIVKQLLAAQADVNMQNKYGDTALHWASYSGHIETVDELLKSDAININTLNKDGGTALMEACTGGHSEIANLLISERALVHHRSKMGSSALLLASRSGLLTTVNELLKKEVDVNVQNEDGWTPLIAATKNHHTEVVRILLDANADVNLSEKSTGWTPLFFAAKEGHLDIVSLLLRDAPVDMRAVDRENRTALQVAQIDGQEAVCQEFINCGYLTIKRSKQ